VVVTLVGLVGDMGEPASGHMLLGALSRAKFFA